MRSGEEPAVESDEPDEPEEPIIGDVNGDETVNIVDLTLLIEVMKNKE